MACLMVWHSTHTSNYFSLKHHCWRRSCHFSPCEPDARQNPAKQSFTLNQPHLWICVTDCLKKAVARCFIIPTILWEQPVLSLNSQCTVTYQLSWQLDLSYLKSNIALIHKMLNIKSDQQKAQKGWRQGKSFLLLNLLSWSTYPYCVSPPIHQSYRASKLWAHLRVSINISSKDHSGLYWDESDLKYLKI